MIRKIKIFSYVKNISKTYIGKNDLKFWEEKNSKFEWQKEIVNLILGKLKKNY